MALADPPESDPTAALIASAAQEFDEPALWNEDDQRQLTSRQSPRRFFIDGMVEGWGPVAPRVTDKLKARFPDIVDQRFWDIANAALPHTALSIQRLYAIFQAIDYLAYRKISGDVVECGVFKGGGAIALIKSLAIFGLTDRKVFLLDTFEGWPEPSAEDTDIFGQNHKKNYHKEIETSSKTSCYRLDNFFERTKSAIYENTREFPESNIIFLKGMVENTLPNDQVGHLCLLRLDTDYYESTKWELQQLYPQLNDNGILLIDDYGQFHGARKAVDEYFSVRREKLLFSRDDFSGRTAIKI